MRAGALLGLLAAALVAGCADRVAGKGVASETTNGIEISGVLRDSLARPVAGRLVELRDPSRDRTVAGTRTDSLGAWTLLAPSPARWLLRAGDESTGVVAWVTVGTAPRQAAPALVETRLGILRGRISSSAVDPAGLVVRLPGTGRTGIVGSDSTFAIPGLPQGWHLATFHEAASGASAGEATFSTWVSRAVRLSPDRRVVLDDFEGNQGEGRLQPVLDGAWWGRWNDTSRIADSARTWAGVAGLYIDSSAREGRSLRVPMRVGDSIPGRPDLVRSAGLVLKLGGDEGLDSASVWHSLERVDSVVFWAKGTGTILLKVKARASSSGGTTGHFQVQFALSPTWKRHAWAPADLPSPEGLSWRTSVAREIQWTTREPSADLWIDDLELVGVVLSDFLAP